MPQIQSALLKRSRGPTHQPVCECAGKVKRQHLAGRAPAEIVVREAALHAEQSKVIQKEMESWCDLGHRRLSIKTQSAGTAKLIIAVNLQLL